MKAHFSVDLASATEPFPHYWELCVGSCHAYTALRADYQRMLKQVHEELGFQYVRFHGLLNDDMSVYTVNMLTGQELYSFHNIDVIFDFLLSIGMKPFIELGFMPTALASGEQTCFLYKGNITPPKSYDKWYELINKLTRHLVDRYGVEEVRTWFFEVWNEPNLKFFWAGTQEEYLKLYTYSVQAIKQVDPLLKVGGPASSGNAWIPDFIEYCQENEVPVDFISTHHYPTSDPLSTQHEVDIEAMMRLGEEERMQAFAALMNPHYERGVMAVMARKAKSEAGELPLYYTEWNSAAFPYKQDDPYAAAFIVKTLADNVGLVEGYSFWTFSDIFEESVQQSLPFHGGFGLLNIDGVPKPSYQAFRIMHGLGTERIPTETCEIETLELLVTKKKNGLYMVLHNHNAPEAEITGGEVRITFTGDLTGKRAVIRTIDEYHANPKAKWLEQGCPEYPSPRELEQLFQAAELVSVPADLKQLPNGDWQLEVSVEPHSVTAIDIQ